MTIEKAQQIYDATREEHTRQNIRWVSANCSDLIEAEQSKRMEYASSLVAKALDLEDIAKHVYDTLKFNAPDRLAKLPYPKPEDALRVNLNLEVDHKNPVANGGELWDEANLWTLCEKHHKLKTKEDMRKVRAARKEARVSSEAKGDST
jgi:5-methylcytosine-specific restriction endonuclease McrA